jgi:hypothetical protein
MFQERMFFFIQMFNRNRQIYALTAYLRTG